MKKSEEQNLILESIKNGHNVMINANPGSGKTTTCIHIMREIQARIMCLTFSKKLFEDSRAKLKSLGMYSKSYDFMGLDAFSYRFYHQKTCGYITNEKPLEFAYDIVIVDESQDLGEKHYKFIRRMLSDNMVKDPIIVIMGDERQCIFQNMDSVLSDERYLTLSRKIHMTSRKWDSRFLTESFRLTDTNSTFINKCLLNSDIDIIKSNKQSIYKPRYIIHTNEYEIFDEITMYINMGYRPDDIFIISPSTTKSYFLTPLLNLITNNTDIGIYVHDEKIKYEMDYGLNKIVCLTHYGCKGLERKVVINLHFDSSFYKFSSYTESGICPNVLFVSSSRPMERLSMFHCHRNDYLTFIDKDKIKLYTEYITGKRIYNYSQIKEIEVKNSSVTDLCKFVNEVTLKSIVLKFTKKIIQRPSTKIKIPLLVRTVYEDKKITEPVSDITGNAIVSWYEKLLLDEMTIYKECLIEYNNYDITLSRENKDRKFSHPEHSEYYRRENNDNWDIQKLLVTSIYYNSIVTNTLYRLKQINTFEWISNENLELCTKRLNDCFSLLGLNPKKNNGRFEKEVFRSVTHGKYLKYELNGRIDYVEDTKLIEFKCKTSLADEDYIQVMLYKYLHRKLNDVDIDCYLFNILTNELIFIDASDEIINDAIIKLFVIKNKTINRIDDNTFISKCQNI